MAIVQISRITNRKGLQENLPQLAGAELGWSIDERRLFIGNGTLEEGAPVIGNTEILTEFSDVLQFQTTYTYKGEAAGYTVQTGPTPTDPVTQSLQTWLDQFASVKDFGATGDGQTDDTDAINRALYQLFCREVNPQIRRSLFFPAGVYRVTSSILIPPYATLYGEGVNNSIIQLDNISADSTLNSFVARTADSLQQYGVSIGTNGATPPVDITVTNMAFYNLDPTTDVFLVEDASNCRFQNVSFIGPLTTVELVTDADDVAGVRFASTASLVCDQIIFDGCKFGGTTYGVNTDEQVKGSTFTNSTFDTLYQGVVLGAGVVVDGGATGVRITGNLFDNIYAEGVIFGDVSLNATGHNIFYGVGNHFGSTTSPYTAVIDIQSSNNISISDLFERGDAYAVSKSPGASYPRINLNDTSSIATTNGSSLATGTYVRESGQALTLLSNVSAQPIFTINTAVVHAFSVDYTILRDTTIRNGVVTAVPSTSSAVFYTDDYTENAYTGIIFGFNKVAGNVTMTYTASVGLTGQLTYSINHLA